MLELAGAHPIGEGAEPPPTVQAWLSGTAWVAPGSTMPSSGATTWEMPCSGSSMSNSLMPLRTLPARIRLQERRALRIGQVVAAGLASGWLWSCTEKSDRAGRTARFELLRAS